MTSMFQKNLVITAWVTYSVSTCLDTASIRLLQVP